MNAPRPIAEQPARRYWIAVSVPAAEVDDDLPDALAFAADRVETVLQEERGYEATAWRAAVPDRAEVLREAAAAADSRKLSHTVGAVADVLRRMANEAPREELAAVVARVGALPVPLGHTEPAAPGFFQPGRTYSHGPWAFRCDAVTTHPETGARTAIGWFRFRKSDWTTEHYGQDVWDEGTWTDTTEESAR